MIRFCYVCQKPFGEIEPVEDKSLSHGVCEVCSPEEMRRVERECETFERKEKHGKNK